MIILFCHPRSGSNCLKEIIETNPEIKITPEPFNLDYLKRFNSEFKDKMNVKDFKTLETYLKLISEKYNGIKTLTEHLSRDLNKKLLSNPEDKIIFLSRKNLLKTAVSKLIAEKTGTWYVDNKSIKGYRRSMKKFEIGNLEIESIRGRIIKFKENNFYYKDFMLKNKIKFFDLYFEDLFENYVSETEKIKKIKEIFEFLGRNEELNLDKIRIILNPKNRKMGSKKIYSRIKNIREIEKSLGSEENGFLFRDKDSKIKNLIEKSKNYLNKLILNKHENSNITSAY